MDLLLHLIRVHEIDIFDIDIYVLTRQYLEYLRVVQFSDLSDASDFLEMAATLTEIKSRMLLPRQTVTTDDGLEIEDDPRRSLQARLLEYERFQKAGAYLGARPQLGVQVLSNFEWQRLEEVYAHVEQPLRGDPAMLVVLFEQALVQYKERPRGRVQAQQHRVTVEEKVEELSNLIDAVRFTLFQGFYNKFQSRYELVVYFLAILELVKMHKVRLHQETLLGPLWVYHAQSADVAALPFAAAAALNPSNDTNAEGDVHDTNGP